MATKILTGVLVPKPGRHQNGNAVILVDPFMVVGDANGIELNQTGPAGAFAQPPSKKVLLRHTKGPDRDPGPGKIATLNVNDGPPNIKYLTVDWNTNGQSEIREMSFLIVGEVADAA